MNKKRQIALLLSLTIMLAGCSNENTIKNDINNETVKVESEQNTSEPVLNEQETTTNTDQVSSSETLSNSSTEVKTEAKIERSEENVINYFEEVRKHITYAEMKESAMDSYNQIKRFIFEEEVVNGYTFAELSIEGKKRIIEKAIDASNYINNKYPEEVYAVKDFYGNLKTEVYDAYDGIKNYLDEKAISNGYDSFTDYTIDLKDKVLEKTIDFLNKLKTND